MVTYGGEDDGGIIILGGMIEIIWICVWLPHDCKLNGRDIRCALLPFPLVAALLKHSARFLFEELCIACSCDVDESTKFDCERFVSRFDPTLNDVEKRFAVSHDDQNSPVTGVSDNLLQALEEYVEGEKIAAMENGEYTNLTSRQYAELALSKMSVNLSEYTADVQNKLVKKWEGE
eukprot:764002-Hanusia_phi.AAC.1